MKRCILLLVTGCSSAPFTHTETTSSPGDAGAPLAAGSAEAPPLVTVNVPWVAPRSSAGGTAGGGSGHLDSGAASEQFGGAAGGGSEALDSGPDSHDSGPARDRLPPGYLAHREHLEASGHSCPALETAVQNCCASPAAVFSCDADGCKCGAQGYGAMASLCSVAPATPLQWGCP